MSRLCETQLRLYRNLLRRKTGLECSDGGGVCTGSVMVHGPASVSWRIWFHPDRGCWFGEVREGSESSHCLCVRRDRVLGRLVDKVLDTARDCLARQRIDAEAAAIPGIRDDGELVAAYDRALARSDRALEAIGMPSWVTGGRPLPKERAGLLLTRLVVAYEAAIEERGIEVGGEKHGRAS